MTVESSSNRAQYATNGTTGPWTVPFYFLDNSHVRVIHTDSSGNETVLTLTTHYSVTGAGVQAGGTVTTVTAYATTVPASYITVLRNVPALQQTDYVDGDKFPAATHEQALDKLTMLIQQLLEVTNRSLVFSPSDTAGSALPAATARANKVLAFNSSGVLTMLVGVDASSASALQLLLASTTLTSEGDAMIGVKYNAPNAVALNLHDWIEDDGSYNMMGFVPQANKAAIRNRTSTANIRTYAQNCIDAIVSERTYGEMKLPMGQAYIESALEMKHGVSIKGPGGRGFVFKAVDCNAINFGFYSGDTDVTLQGFGIEGLSGTTRIAIYQPGSDSENDELYGVRLIDLRIRNFNKILKAKTFRNLWVDRLWGQDCNAGFDLAGKNLMVRLNNMQLVKAAGNGAGASYGILFDYGSFNAGATLIPPEGVKLNNLQSYGFDYGVRMVAANSVDICGGDILALIYGYEFTTVQDGLNITGGHCEISGAAGLAGLIGHGLASAIESKILIEGVSFRAVSSAAATSVGVQINDSGNTNQNNVTVRSNSFDGFTLRDIQGYAMGPTNIEDNTCRSNVAGLYSIAIDSVTKGNVYVDKNQCTKDISYAVADVQDAELIIGVNRVNDTTLIFGDETIKTVASAAALTLTLGGSRSFKVSGTTSVTSIVASGWTGKSVTLIFQDVLTVTDGSNLRLQGNFVTSVDDSITLYCDGTNWFEVARSPN